MNKLLENALDALAEAVDEYREAQDAFLTEAQRFGSSGATDETRQAFDRANAWYRLMENRVFNAALVTASQWREV